MAAFAPIMVTEIDWAPKKYDATWEKCYGTAGSEGFGANFKYIADNSGNVSWLFLLRSLMNWQHLRMYRENRATILFSMILKHAHGLCIIGSKSMLKVW